MLAKVAGRRTSQPSVGRSEPTRRSLATACVVIALLLGCRSRPEWARYSDGTPIRADEEAEASLVLDSFDSNPSLLALIEIRRGDTVCAVCTLEKHIDAERDALQHFLSKPRPPWAVERAHRRLELIARHREKHPFDPDECPPVPCMSDPELALEHDPAAPEPRRESIEP